MWFYYQLLVAPKVHSDSLHWPFISIFSIQFQHVINFWLHSISYKFSISCSDYYTCFCACSVMFYVSFIQSYMLSTFQVLMHTCATSSCDIGSDSQYPDHALIDFRSPVQQIQWWVFILWGQQLWVSFQSLVIYFEFLLDLAGACPSISSPS